MEESQQETVDTSRYRLTPLNANNYFLWSHKLDFVLRTKVLLQIVTGEEKIPSDATEKAKFRRRSDLALANIIFSIDDSVNAAVITIGDPNKMWGILKEKNATVSEARIDSYLQKYQIAQMLQEESISLFVNRLQDIEDKLASIGHVIPDTEKRRTLLRGLTNTFDISAGIIRATGKTYHKSVAFLTSAEVDKDERKEPNVHH